MPMSQTSLSIQSSVSNKEKNMGSTTIVLIFNQLGSTCSIVHHSCLQKSKSSLIMTLKMPILTTKNYSRNSFITMKTSRRHMYRMSMYQIMSWKNSMLSENRYAAIVDGTPALVNLEKLTPKSSVSKFPLVKSSLRRISTVSRTSKNLRKIESITLRNLKVWISIRAKGNPALS